MWRSVSRQLEEELRTLKEEHSVLKDMVRDLEQMKENEEKQIKSGGCPLDVIDERAMTAMAKASVLNNVPGATSKPSAAKVSFIPSPIQLDPGVVAAPCMYFLVLQRGVFEQIVMCIFLARRLCRSCGFSARTSQQNVPPIRWTV